MSTRFEWKGGTSLGLLKKDDERVILKIRRSRQIEMRSDPVEKGKDRIQVGTH